MKCQEIIERIEKRYPREYACDWDNPGLLAGDREQEVDLFLNPEDSDRMISAAAAGTEKRSIIELPIPKRPKISIT